MFRIIFTGIAAVALGAVGGLALKGAPHQTLAASELQPATVASATVATPPKLIISAPTPTVVAAPAPKPTPVVAAPKPAPEAAPAPKAAPAPAALPIPADLLKERPEVRFNGDRVSVRLGKYKIEF